MIEIKKQIGPSMSIFLIKDSTGKERPLRYDGRDFIKVLYEPPTFPHILQCFYRSTGLHSDQEYTEEEIPDDPTAAYTAGTWTPCDGIALEDRESFITKYKGIVPDPMLIKWMPEYWKKSEVHFTKVDYAGKQFADDNWLLPKYKKAADYRRLPNYNPCDAEYNENDVLCRFGNCTLSLISYLLSSPENIFWHKSKKGKLLKNLCGLNDIVPYSPQIPEGINANWIVIDKFIGSAVSYNHINIDSYRRLKEMYGLFDIKDCIVDHPKRGETVLEDVMQKHCKSPEGIELNSIFITKDINPEKIGQRLKEEIERDNFLLEEVAAASVGSSIELPENFKEKCDTFDLAFLNQIADELGVSKISKNGKQVNRKTLCSRIFLKIQE